MFLYTLVLKYCLKNIGKCLGRWNKNDCLKVWKIWISRLCIFENIISDVHVNIYMIKYYVICKGFQNMKIYAIISDIIVYLICFTWSDIKLIKQIGRISVYYYPYNSI